MWLEATGDSRIVDIRQVKRVSDAARYVAKYVAKPLDTAATRDHTALVEAVQALHGQRLCGAIGTWKLQLSKPHGNADGWHALTDLQSLLLRLSSPNHPHHSLLRTILAQPTTRLPPDVLHDLVRAPPCGDSSSASTQTSTAQRADYALNHDWLTSCTPW